MKHLLFLSIFMMSEALLASGSYWGRIHRHYQSARPLGMGDAFVALSDDYSSLFYNPAGLANISESQINLSLDIAATSAFSDFYSDVAAVGEIQDSVQKTNAYVELFQKNYGNIFGGRSGTMQGVWVRPGWGIAFLPLDVTLEMTVHNQAFPALATRLIADSTLAFGFGRHVKSDHLGGKLQWGTTFKLVNRNYLNMDLNVADLVIDSTIFRRTDMTEGYALDGDIGFLYTPFLSEGFFGEFLRLARPTFGLVIRNVMGGEFNGSFNLLNNEAQNKPEKMERVFDFGTRWEYPEVFIFSGRGVMDFKNIGHPQYSFKKGFHLGFEFDWRMASWWKGQYRFGLSQGYLTAGLSALFTVFRLDFVTYGEEVGSESNPLESRSYMVRMNMDF